MEEHIKPCMDSSSHQRKVQNLHMKTVHQAQSKNEIVYDCDKCSKTFANKSRLKLHTESVHDGIKYPCKQCSKSFGRKDTLKLHIKRTHNNVEELQILEV